MARTAAENSPVFEPRVIAHDPNVVMGGSAIVLKADWLEYKSGERLLLHAHIAQMLLAHGVAETGTGV